MSVTASFSLSSFLLFYLKAPPISSFRVITHTGYCNFPPVLLNNQQHNSAVIITIKSSASAQSTHCLCYIPGIQSGVNLQFSESDINTKNRSMKSRRYSPRVSRLFLSTGVNDSPVVTQVVIKIPATLRTALSATSSWRMDRGWYLCHSSRLTRSHSIDLTLWTLESADHTYDSSDHPEPHVNWDVRL